MLLVAQAEQDMSDIRDDQNRNDKKINKLAREINEQLVVEVLVSNLEKSKELAYINVNFW